MWNRNKDLKGSVYWICHELNVICKTVPNWLVQSDWRLSGRRYIGDCTGITFHLKDTRFLSSRIETVLLQCNVLNCFSFLREVERDGDLTWSSPLTGGGYFAYLDIYEFLEGSGFDERWRCPFRWCYHFGCFVWWVTQLCVDFHNIVVFLK